jgi:hypothetical protein
MPDLKEITIEDKKTFDEYLNRYPQEISEMTFTNFFVWRKSKEHKFTIFEGHLLVSGKNFFYQPVGPGPEKIIEKILNEFPNASFERVEKKIADKLVDKFKVTAQEDMYDYVYNTQELVELKGNKFEPKRNLAKQCEKMEPEVCGLDDDTVHHFFELQDKWFNLKTCEIDHPLTHENEAIVEALKYHNELNLSGACVHKHDMIVGFAIGEKLNDNTFVEHFEKADTNFKGIYQFVLREFCKSIPNEFTFLNREQDLGIVGLKKAKMSYNPVRMVEKFRIENK